MACLDTADLDEALYTGSPVDRTLTTPASGDSSEAGDIRHRATWTFTFSLNIKIPEYGRSA